MSPLSLANPEGRRHRGNAVSLLLTAAFWLIRISLPADPHEPGAWLRTSSNEVDLGLNLLPFAGVEFLWFIGVRAIV